MLVWFRNPWLYQRCRAWLSCCPGPKAKADSGVCGGFLFVLITSNTKTTFSVSPYASLLHGEFRSVGSLCLSHGEQSSLPLFLRDCGPM